MSQIFKENIPLLSKTSGTTLTLAATYEGKAGRVTVGGRQYPVTAALVLNTATTGVNGLDTGALASNTLYYIYAVRNSSTAGLAIVASTAAPTTGPTGFTGWKEIGRFRTFLGSAAIAIVINKLVGNNRAPSGSEGGPVTDWASCTFTGAWVSNTTYNAKYKREGDTVEFDVNLVLAGAPTSTNLILTLPTDFSADTNKLSSGIDVENIALGIVAISDTGTANFTGAIRYLSTSTVRVEINVASGTYTSNASVTQAVPMTFTSGDEIYIRFKLPIAEFAGLWT